MSQLPDFPSLKPITEEPRRLARPVNLDEIEVGTVSLARGADNVNALNLKDKLDVLAAYRRALIVRTSESHWTEFGNGIAYLHGNGGYAVANLGGLSVSRPVFDPPSCPDELTTVSCEVAVAKDGREIWGFDDCSIVDSMLEPWQKLLADRDASAKVIRETLYGLMKKKAAQGAVGRAVGAWFGIAGLTMDELKALGLRTEKIAGVKFRKGTGGKAVAATIAEMLAMPKGSLAAINVLVGTCQPKTPGTKAPNRLAIRDDTGTAWLSVWGDLPEWCKPGATIFAEAKVGEYQGKPQFAADKIEQAQADEAPDDSQT